MSDELYEYLPDLPKKVSAASVLARMIDGTAYRYKWSLEGLDDSYLDFRPVDGSMNLKELLEHNHMIAEWLCQSFVDRKFSEKPIGDLHSMKEQTLQILKMIRDHVVTMSDEELGNIKVHHDWSDEKIPFWLLINGPIADILTHAGQICSWRRIAGNPILKANLFRGKPPEDWK